MDKILGPIFAVGQHLCNFLAVVLTIYLLYRWNAEQDIDPTFNAFNPWWPGLVLFALGAVFKFARKGVSPQAESQTHRTDA